MSEGRARTGLRARLEPAICEAAPHVAAVDAEAILEAVIQALLEGQPRHTRWRNRLIEDAGGRPICGICDLPIPMDALPDSPEQFSVDHIVPRCEGGAKLGYENLRPAHRYCNALRGTPFLKPKVRRRYELFLEGLRARYAEAEQVA